MLDPANRAALTEELIPPRGFRLAQAVGTTFTLDLNAALAVPLAFSGFRQSEEDSGRPDEQKTSVIAALLTVSEKIDIFAQAGALRAERTSELFELLGPVIHQVAPRQGMLFHPKAWFLEFQNDQDARSYRLICSSQNLTFDRTWDTMIRLDGVPADTTEGGLRAAERNAPLHRFVEHLCTDEVLTSRLPAPRRRRIMDFSQRLSTVDWATPEGVKALRFQVFGVPGVVAPEPEPEGRQRLIVSPFLTPDGVARLAGRARRKKSRVTLVSRAESLDGVGSAALEGMETWVLDGAAEDGADDDAGLTGLHAKLVALTTERRGRLLIGSANATGPGWDGNVELMVDVESTSQQFRPGPLFDSMKEMLQPYSPETVEPDEALQVDELEKLQRAALEIGSAPMTVCVSGEGPYRLEVSAEQQRQPAVIARVSWHLLHDRSSGGEGLPAQQPVVFEEVPLTRISPFIRLSVEDASGLRASTIVLADLRGDPPQRREAIIAARLADPQKLLALIMLLLEFSGSGTQFHLLDAADAGADSAWKGRGVQFPGLLEALLRALAAGPDGMAEAQRILQFIRRSPEGADLPEDFLQLWDAAWTAHQAENLEGTP